MDQDINRILFCLKIFGWGGLSPKYEQKLVYRILYRIYSYSLLVFHVYNSVRYLMFIPSFNLKVFTTTKALYLGATFWFFQVAFKGTIMHNTVNVT